MKTPFKTILALTVFLPIVLSCFLPAAEALEDQFEISLSVASGDTSAPSVPTNLSATAVSTSQINLSWTASTDNVGVSGYKVFRDNAFIANSTATSYSDSGLSADTTYAYTVSAFDASSNESARSATSSATTFSASTPSGGGGGSVHLSIYDVLINTTQTSAVLNWKTSKDSKGVVSWGLSPNYELGSSAEIDYLLTHQINITSLSPGNLYYFQIEVIDGGGRKNSYTGTFTTVGITEVLPNPTNFSALSNENSIDLSWTNPQVIDFDSVRLVRSDKFFPTDPYDGQVIYEGEGGFFADEDVEKNKRYFYAIFAKDKNDRYSSGAVTSGRIVPPGTPSEEPGEVIEEIPKAPNVHPLISALKLADFDFIQLGKKLPITEDKIFVDGGKNLTMSLDYEKIPEVLKTILVTLVDPEDDTKVFSFILKIDEERTRYVATIGPLGRSGRYEVRINIVDYKNQGLKKLQGFLLATVGQFDSGSPGSTAIFNYIWLLLLLAAIILVIFYIRKKMKELHDGDGQERYALNTNQKLR